MHFFTKHSVPAVPRADISVNPDSSKKPRKIHKFTMTQFRVKNNQNCPKNSSKFSIFRFSRSECKTDNSTDVEARLDEQDAVPTYALSTSVSKMREDRNSSSDLSPETYLSETSQDEECCPCLLEDSYHPDKVHKKHWYTVNRKKSCKVSCSTRDDQKSRQPLKHFHESFTPITRPFRRFLHQNSDNGIHYFFESRDSECYNSTESFKTLFGCNNTICQACDSENNCLSMFPAPPVPISGKICPPDDCFSTEATLVKLNQPEEFYISLGSVFDNKTQECSTAIPVLACEGQDCSSPASVVLARETEQCSATNIVIANNEQNCSPSVNLILSCGAQECPSVSSAPTIEKEPCSSAVDLVLGCVLKECGPICQALDITSQESGSKSTLFLLGNRLGICSTNACAVPSKEFDCDSESPMLVNKSDQFCASRSTLSQCRAQNSPSAITLSKKELSCHEYDTTHQSDEFKHEMILSTDKECDSLDTGFMTRPEKSPCTDSSINLDSSKRQKCNRFTFKQFRVKTKQKCPTNRTKVSIFRLSESKFTNDNSAVVEAHAAGEEALPTDGSDESASSIHKDCNCSSDLSPDVFLSETSQFEKCCVCLLEDSYHPDKVHKQHWYTINRKKSCKNSCSMNNDQQCRRPRKHLKESFSQITAAFSRYLHQNSEDGIHYLFESKDSECYESTQSFDKIFGCNETVCQTCDTENGCLSIFSTPPVPRSVKICSSENCLPSDTTSAMGNKPVDGCISIGSVFDCGPQKGITTMPALAFECQDCSSTACGVLLREALQCSSTNSVITSDEQYCQTSVNLILSCGAHECTSVSSVPTCEKEPSASSVDLALGCELKGCGQVCHAFDSTALKSDSKSTLVLFGNRPRLHSANVCTQSCKAVDCAPNSSVLVNMNDMFCSTETNSQVEDGKEGALVLPSTNECASTSTLSPCNSQKSSSDISFTSDEPSCRKEEFHQQSDEHESEDFEHESFSSTEQECGSPVSSFLARSEKCNLIIRNLSPHMSKECF